MTSYDIGYGKPPQGARFRPGVSGNPRGRPKRKSTWLADRIKTAMNAPIKYRDRGRIKVATYREIRLKLIVDRAVAGDLDAAEMVLKILARPERYGDAGSPPIVVKNWLPDYPGQTANQKSADFSAAREVAPPEWWSSSET